MDRLEGPGRHWRSQGGLGAGEEGLQGPWGVRVTGGGATGAVECKGDGRRGYRGGSCGCQPPRGIVGLPGRLWADGGSCKSSANIHGMIHD